MYINKQMDSALNIRGKFVWTCARNIKQNVIQIKMITISIQGYILLDRWFNLEVLIELNIDSTRSFIIV